MLRGEISYQLKCQFEIENMNNEYYLYSEEKNEILTVNEPTMLIMEMLSEAKKMNKGITPDTIFEEFAQRFEIEMGQKEEVERDIGEIFYILENAGYIEKTLLI